MNKVAAPKNRPMRNAVNPPPSLAPASRKGASGSPSRSNSRKCRIRLCKTERPTLREPQKSIGREVREAATLNQVRSKEILPFPRNSVSRRSAETDHTPKESSRIPSVRSLALRIILPRFRSPVTRTLRSNSAVAVRRALRRSEGSLSSAFPFFRLTAPRNLRKSADTEERKRSPYFTGQISEKHVRPRQIEVAALFPFPFFFFLHAFLVFLCGSPRFVFKPGFPGLSLFLSLFISVSHKRSGLCFFVFSSAAR